MTGALKGCLRRLSPVLLITALDWHLLLRRGGDYWQIRPCQKRSPLAAGRISGQQVPGHEHACICENVVWVGWVCSRQVTLRPPHSRPSGTAVEHSSISGLASLSHSAAASTTKLGSRPERGPSFPGEAELRLLSCRARSDVAWNEGSFDAAPARCACQGLLISRPDACLIAGIQVAISHGLHTCKYVRSRFHHILTRPRVRLTCNSTCLFYPARYCSLPTKKLLHSVHRAAS